MGKLSQETEDKVRLLVATDRKILAIKLCREEAGLSIKKAKLAVDTVMNNPADLSNLRSKTSLETKLINKVWIELWDGRKTDAIKVYRQITGADHREAEAAIKLMEENPDIEPHLALSPVETHQRTSLLLFICFGFLAVALGFALVFWIAG